MITELTIAFLNNDIIENWDFFGIKITWLVIIYAVLIIAPLRFRQGQKRKEQEKAHNDLKGFLELVQTKPSLDASPIKHQIDEYFKERNENPSPTVKQLCHAWREFSEGVKEYNGEWMNVYQAEEFFKSSLLVEPVVKPLSYYATWASSSGLLFTFIALTAGLSELNYAGVGEIKGIGDFINALSGKFITSIIGLFLAVAVFDNQHRKAVEVLTHTLDDIVYELNRSFKRLTSQHILLQIQKDVHELPQAVIEGFEKLDGESGVIKSIEIAISEGIKSQVGEIKDAIGKVPTAISEELTPPMERLDINTKAIAETLGASTEGVADKISQGISTELKNLNDTMSLLPKTMETLITKMGEGQDESVGKLTAELTGKVTDLMTQVTKNTKTVNDTMNTSLTTLTDIVKKLDDANTTTGKQTGEAITQIKEGATAASNTIKGNLQDVLAQLTTAVNNFGKVGEEAPPLLEKAFRDFEKLIQNQFTPFVTTQDGLLNTLGGHVSTIAGIETDIQAIEAKLTQLQRDLASAYTDHNTLTKEQLDALKQSIADLQGLMSDHQVRVGQLNQQYGNMDDLAQNIATTFADSGDKMANNVENIMTKSSKQYLEDFSQKHNNAIASIQTMAENIAEALSDKGIQAVAPPKVNR
jgi:hypothetical protein